MVHPRSPASILQPNSSTVLARFVAGRARVVLPSTRLESTLHNARDSIRDFRGSEERLRHKEAERDFFLSVLGASATRRDAKAYLSRFKPSDKGQDRPVLATKHIAVIKLRALSSLDDAVVDGLCQTISQMTRLGLSCVIVLDFDNETLGTSFGSKAHHAHMSSQADRLARGLQAFSSIKASRLDDLLEIMDVHQEVESTVQVKGSVEVLHPKLLTRLLERGVIPVIISAAISHDNTSMSAMAIAGDDAVLALTRYFAGLRAFSQTLPDARISAQTRGLLDAHSSPYVLERLVILDPVGALPSARQAGRGHVFVNLEQEYHSIHDELLKRKDEERDISIDQASQSECKRATSSAATASRILQTRDQHERRQSNGATADLMPHISRHIKNLQLLRSTLSLLPPSSSAFLTTPIAAATLRTPGDEVSTPGVGTRRPKNPLIFNLLTDKPLNSSSLPTSRILQNKATATQGSPDASVATFAKRGMQLTMIPNPLIQSWRAPAFHETHMSLQDPDIDFPRLLNLIEDSFNRPLDVEDYLNRIQDRIAGIIVAGEYEGGALLTWELPPGVSDDGSETTRQRMVPYLDKFAVLKRSQGAGGVADIVFSAMVRSCFPDGVCWRSRKDNPVNKWYFERAAGTWKIPDSNWTMFWTDSDLPVDGKRFLDYEAVCRSVRPSWANNKAIAD